MNPATTSGDLLDGAADAAAAEAPAATEDKKVFFPEKKAKPKRSRGAAAMREKIRDALEAQAEARGIDRGDYLAGRMLTSKVSDANGKAIARGRFVLAHPKRAETLVLADRMELVEPDAVNTDRGPVVYLDDEDRGLGEDPAEH